MKSFTPMDGKASNNSREKLALYVHWPFCLAKCPYCDFNSHVADRIDASAWEKAYIKELEYFKDIWQHRPLSSIFFGGGTPSLMPPGLVKTLLGYLREHHIAFPEDIEITLEANPTSVEAAKMQAFYEAGINRVSLGIQAFIPKDLEFLGRKHSREEALNALEVVRAIFPRYSFDLIYARPGQTVEAWEQELRYALSFAGEHLSLYQLTIEKGTPFYAAYQRQAFTLPSEDDAASLYACTQAVMHDAGLPAYEISNHAKPGAECRHNMMYWEYQDYLGIGPGAHSRLTAFSPHHLPTKHAIMMIHSPEEWLRAVASQQQGMQSCTALTPLQQLEEFLLMGLRIRDGISHQRFQEFYHTSLDRILPTKALTWLTEQQFLCVDTKGIRATEKGFPVLNTIVEKLIPA